MIDHLFSNSPGYKGNRAKISIFHITGQIFHYYSPICKPDCFMIYIEHYAEYQEQP